MKSLRQILLSASDLPRILGLGSLGLRGVIVPSAVLLIVSLFVLPVPRELLDLLLSINLAISLIILLRAIFVTDALSFYAFPTVLLLTTLFRLGLNISSTRLILLKGEQGTNAAGRVIEAFGQFVVSGDFIVGAIVFIVVATVNYLVVAKGSARVAEVAARFTLDALPGKQLAIDSELRSGNINRDEANRRRTFLNRESQFYGAMDGAMKFVQGDAIASIVIAFINAVGGVGIGLSRGLGFEEARNTFGVLAVGDGLVSIVPSLLISVCAGVVVTRVSGGNTRVPGEDLLNQIFADSRALVVAAVAFLLMSVTPGLPGLPFLIVGVLLLVYVAKREAENGRTASSGMGGSSPGSSLEQATFYIEEEHRFQLPKAAILEIDGALASEYARSGTAREKLYRAYAELQDRVFRKRGVILPDLEVRSVKGGESRSYRVLAREAPVRAGILPVGSTFVVCAKGVLELVRGRIFEASQHPIDRRGAVWMVTDASVEKSLRRLGVEVLEPSEFLAAETAGALLDVVVEIFGLDEIKRCVDILRREHVALVQEVFDKGIITLPEFSEVLRRLVRERVSVRDLHLIVGGVAEYYALEQEREDRTIWLAGLHRYLRTVLGRAIVQDCLGPSGKLRGFFLAPEVEEEFRSAIASWDSLSGKPPLEPHIERALRENAERLFAPVLERGATPVVLLVAQDIRLAVHEFFTERSVSAEWFRTLAFEELGGREKLESVGVVHV